MLFHEVFQFSSSQTINTTKIRVRQHLANMWLECNITVKRHQSGSPHTLILLAWCQPKIQTLPFDLTLVPPRPRQAKAMVSSSLPSRSIAAFLFLFSLPPADTSSFVSQHLPPESLGKSFVKHSCASSTSRLSASADTDLPPPHPPTCCSCSLHPPKDPAHH